MPVNKDAEKRTSALTIDAIREKIVPSFLHEHVEDVRVLDGGHINQSFCVITKEKQYVLQCLCSSRYTAEQIKALEQDYLLYRNACEAAAETGVFLECPQWIRDKDGSFFRTDETGDHWRMYGFIPGDMKTVPMSENDLVACGEGLARLHSVLSLIEGIPQAVYSHMHDLVYYYEEYCKQDQSEKMRVPELDQIIEAKIDGFLKLSYSKEDVVHGDAKLGNMIFSENNSQGRSRIKAFIDLDTLMVGSRLEDIADLIRSCCKNREEDEARVTQAILKGYQAAAKELSGDIMLTKEETEFMPDIVDKICFELGLRYYTDHLSGSNYFSEQQPGQNLQKAKKWLAGCKI